MTLPPSGPLRWEHTGEGGCGAQNLLLICLENVAGLSGLLTFWTLQVSEPHLIYPRSLCPVFPRVPDYR